MAHRNSEFTHEKNMVDLSSSLRACLPGRGNRWTFWQKLAVIFHKRIAVIHTQSYVWIGLDHRSPASWYPGDRLSRSHSKVWLRCFWYVTISLPRFKLGGCTQNVKLHVSRCFWGGPWTCKLTVEGILKTPPQKRYLRDVQRPILYVRGGPRKCILHFGMGPPLKSSLKGVVMLQYIIMTMRCYVACDR